MVNKTERKAIDTFKRLCWRRHWKFEETGGKKGSNCDFKINGIKVEVKGSKSDSSIPDTYHTEFSRNLKFKPKWLFIVYLPEKDRARISAIPKRELDKYKHSRKTMVRWSSTLKTDMSHGKYLKIPKKL